MTGWRRWLGAAVVPLVLAACGADVDVARLTRAGVVESPAVAPAVEAPALPAPAPVEDTAGVAGAPLSARTAAVARPVARQGRHALGDIEIPRIGMRQSLYEGIALSTLRYGPGHWPGTAMPGHFGNAVIAGHRITNTRPFFDIDQLTPGDTIIVTTAEGLFVYEMTEHLIVRPNEVWIAHDTDGAILTLFACHPKGSKSRRYVVRARLASTPLARDAGSAGAGSGPQSLPDESSAPPESPPAPPAEPAPPPEPAPESEPARCRSVVCLPRRSA